MTRIAWLFRITERTLYGWRGAYKKGGVNALRSHPGNRGRPRKADIATLEAAMDALLARNAQADVAKNVQAAKEARDAKEAAEAGAAPRPTANAKCIACMIEAGLASAGEWHAGRDGVPQPGRRGRGRAASDCLRHGGRPGASAGGGTA